METVRYGVIGAGGMSRGHLGCLKEIEDIEIVAVADPHEKNLERYREENDHPHTRYVADYKEILEMDTVDAVLIATPDNTHVDIALDAIAAEKHVFSEKPAATRYEDFERLEKAVTRSSRIYQVGLECRFLPVYRKMRALIEEKAIGSPRMIWCHEFRGPFLEKVNNWILFQESTGGAFVEKTCHYFDLMTWFAGSPPEKVTALAGQDVVKELYGVKPDILDNGWAMIEYQNGVKGVLGLCMFCKCENDIEIGVVGDAGKMQGYFTGEAIDFCAYGKEEVRIDARADPEIGKLSHGGGVYYEHLHFVDAVRNNKPPLTDIQVAKWSLYIGLAAEESARNGSTPVCF